MLAEQVESSTLLASRLHLDASFGESVLQLEELRSDRLFDRDRGLALDRQGLDALLAALNHTN
jgi:hypothetical protein